MSDSESIPHICVAIDGDTSNECLYINGKAWKSCGEITVYACDIAEATPPDGIIRFERRYVVQPESGWPKNLEDLPIYDD